jgi:hypothetical protein
VDDEVVPGLKRKVALITGGAIALKFAHLGIDLALSGVRLKPEDMHTSQVRDGWRSIESVGEEVRALGGVYHCRRLKQWEDEGVWLDAWRALLGTLDEEGLLKKG